MEASCAVLANLPRPQETCCSTKVLLMEDIQTARPEEQPNDNEDSGRFSHSRVFDRCLDVGVWPQTSPWRRCWMGSWHSSPGGTLYIGGVFELPSCRQVSANSR